MSASLLVSVCELAEHLDDPDWRIIDCRFDLARPEAGETAYREGHIPGAIYAHLERDLSGPITASSGRHPLPDPQRLSTTFARWGTHTTTRVICYDAQANAYAARLWWLLRWLGHQRVAVLDGGLTAWEAQHLPLDTTVPRPEPRPFTGGARAEMWVTTAELAASVEHGRPCIIDVRTPERFAGAKEPLDPVAGHIPGARNLPFQMNVDAGGCYLPREALMKMYYRVLDGCAPAEAVVMCGSGVTACHTLLALELAGLHGAKLYAGSWSEWIRCSAHAVAVSGG